MQGITAAVLAASGLLLSTQCFAAASDPQGELHLGYLHTDFDSASTLSPKLDALQLSGNVTLPFKTYFGARAGAGLTQSDLDLGPDACHTTDGGGSVGLFMRDAASGRLEYDYTQQSSHACGYVAASARTRWEGVGTHALTAAVIHA